MYILSEYQDVSIAELSKPKYVDTASRSMNARYCTYSVSLIFHTETLHKYGVYTNQPSLDYNIHHPASSHPSPHLNFRTFPISHPFLFHTPFWSLHISTSIWYRTMSAPPYFRLAALSVLLPTLFLVLSRPVLGNLYKVNFGAQWQFLTVIGLALTVLVVGMSAMEGTGRFKGRKISWQYTRISEGRWDT